MSELAAIIDAQVHIWDWNSLTHREPLVGRPELEKNVLPNDLYEQFTLAGVSHGILVEAEKSSYSLSIWWLEVTEYCPYLKNTVLGCDLARDNLELWVEAFRQWDGFRGMRTEVSWLSDWKQQPTVLRSLQLLAQGNFCLDVELSADELPHLAEVAREHSNLRFVINHAAAPPADGGDLGAWSEQLTSLVDQENVFVKTSDLSLGHDPAWRTSVLLQLVETLGAHRVMWGSGWPVLRPEVSYRDMFEADQQSVAALPQESRDSIFGGNAARIYRL